MLGWLVEEWRRRLWQMNRAIERPKVARPQGEGGERWLWAIRFRILTFLVKRHAQRLEDELYENPSRKPRIVHQPTFCAVDHPTYHGPRDITTIRPLLDQIRAANERPRRRWWRLF